MSVDPVDMQNFLLPLIDRMITPLVDRLDQMDARAIRDNQTIQNKLDIAAQIGHQITASDTRQDGIEKRQDIQDATLLALAADMNVQKGRNQIITWLLALLGAPVVVALALAGIAKLFGIQVGM